MDKVFTELMEQFEAATWKDLCLLHNLQLKTPSDEIMSAIRKARKELVRIRKTEYYTDETIRATKQFKNNAGRRVPSKTE